MSPSSWLWPVLAAPFVGSFLGVLVMRLPIGRSAIVGRSACDHCGRVLGAADLVPIASWLWWRGRCRHCGEIIGPIYPVIELGALTIALWAATVDEGLMLWASCILGWSLLTLAIIDLRDGLLPDALTLPLLAFGLVTAYLADPSLVLPHLTGAVVGFASFAVIRWLYRLLRGREGLGRGDLKLLAASGAWVSWDGLPSVVLIAALTGLLAVLVGRIAGRRLTLDQRLAFGPYLCLGTWLVWLYGPFG